MTVKTRIDGACHCRNLTFELRWPASEPAIVARCCGCTFCTRHGGAWTSHPDAELEIRIADASAVSRYRFGTKTAEFFVCRHCGVSPVVSSEIDGIRFAVVNVNTFESPGDLAVSTTTTDFDGEDTGSRLERRKRNWIPGVEILTSARG